MRKFIIPTIILAVIAAFAVTPAVASAAGSCSPSGKGGEKAPGVGDDNSVEELGAQGYICTIAWDAEIQPEYESGGTWHYPPEIPPWFHPNTPDQFWPAGSAYNWSLTLNAERDGDHVFFATGTEDTPACSFNWRFQVNFFGMNHFVFQSDVSPQTNKTC